MTPLPPPITPPHARRPPWLRALVAAIAGVFALAVVSAIGRATDDGGDHPDEWDPRVAALAEFVEDERGLEFKHPVHVEFLTSEEYSEETTSDEADLADEDRRELARFAGELRAFGVATGEIDLFAALNQVADAGTLAFYDTEDQRVKVRGTEMSVGMEVTLVHELTHALQDQHFDLDRLRDGELDGSAQTALLGLVEGDALRIESAYTDNDFTDEERAAYDTEFSGQLEDSRAATSDVPPFLSATFGAPYALGQPFVVMLLNEGGNRAVDEAFRNPPTTEEHLFDPASFLAGEGGEELDLDLDDDVDVRDDGPFGSPSWFLLLAERIDPKVAFTAVLGWAGDHYATFERDDRTCVRAAFVGDTDADDAEMTDALAAWAAAMPPGTAEAMEIGGHPGLESCDPGTEVADPNLTGRSEQALFMPSLWGYLIADAASQLDAAGSRCYARHVMEGLTFEQIVDPEGAAFQEEGFQQRLVAAFQACV